jgi:hypothetical protein
VGEASSTIFCAAAQYAALLRPTNCLSAADNAKPTNSGGVYGHTLTFSEPGSNNLRTISHADPTGLLVATPVEGNANLLIVREYKGY